MFEERTLSLPAAKKIIYLSASQGYNKREGFRLRGCTNMNTFKLPAWLSTGMVFQQGVPLLLSGNAGQYSSVTLEVVKDPTDGRRVSKLDTDYGVIMSLETRTDETGVFSFELPAYKASTDAYTLIFHSVTESITIKDLRCGDVWVFLGSQPLCVPISRAGAPRTPLKEKSLSLIRFFMPERTGLSADGKYSYTEADRTASSSWIHIKDSALLSAVSSVAFSMAYHLADQLHYPIGILDLALEGSALYSWMSREGIESSDELITAIKEKKLFLSENDWNAYFGAEKASKTTVVSEQTDSNKTQITVPLDLSVDSSKPGVISPDTVILPETEVAKESQTKTTVTEENKKVTDEASSGNVKAISGMAAEAAVKKHLIEDNIPKERLMTALYNNKLIHFRDVSIRGIVYAPDITDSALTEQYPQFIRQFLIDMSRVFGPKKIIHKSTVPSLILLQISPETLDQKNPLRYFELNETLSSIRRKLPMPIGILSQHDLLLPEKAKTFTIGRRLAFIALGLHFTPKMPSSSPECIGVEIVANKIMLNFDNTVDGLKLAENESILRGFSICGEDRVYMPASARILHGVRVMVWHDDIAQPTGVTYAYCPVPHLATFRNRADLPVLPFRFDREKSDNLPDLTFASCDSLEFIGRRTWESPFEILPIFKVIKGEGDICKEVLNKTQGSAALRIEYLTENSQFNFGPVLDYATLFAPLNLSRFKQISIDIFNPDLAEKVLTVSGFSGRAVIQVGLRWQTLVLPVEGNDPLLLQNLEIGIFDTQRNGSLYVDNIRFLR
jgi:hypothetical protein